MKQVSIYRGIPGSGKSTIAEEEQRNAIASGHSVSYCSADKFFEDQNGIYTFEAKLIGNAHVYCMRRFIDGIIHLKRDMIIVDNTFTQVWEYTPYLSIALSEGYDIKIIEVKCDQQVAFKRQTHGVPAEHHKRMADRFQKVLPQHKQYLRTIKNG